MHTEQSNVMPVDRLERSLVLLGAVGCTALTVVVWRNVSTYQDMRPLPALYFIEVTALTVLSAILFLRRAASAGAVLWGTTGGLAVFCFLGMFSVGLLYLPIGLAFAAACLLSAFRLREGLLVHVLVCLVSGLAQAALMLIVVRLSTGIGW